MKALLHYRASPGFRAALAAAGERAGVATVVVDEDDEAGFAREARDAQVLLHVLKPVTPAMMQAAPALALIQKIGVGVNTIDLQAAEARGIAVANMPGTNSQAVAEMTLALMLAVLRRLSYLDPLTRAGRGWAPDPQLMDGVGELGGRTVGFVGYGAAPERLAPALAALGCRILYTAAHGPKPGRPGEYRPLGQLLEEADIVSLHLPATPPTRGLIDAAALAQMKPGAILINTARGELVDEPALVEALRSGRLGGAGLDVFRREPLPAGDPLAGLNTVVLAPHVAWLTPETLARSLGVAMENCRRVAAGEPLLNRVV